MCLCVVCGGVLFFQCLRMIFLFLAFKSRRTGKSRCSFLNMDVLPDKCKCVVRVWVVRIWVVRRYKFFGFEVNSIRCPNCRPHTMGVSDFLGCSWMTRVGDQVLRSTSSRRLQIRRRDAVSDSTDT
jgi:hypothetical protein